MATTQACAACKTAATMQCAGCRDCPIPDLTTNMSVYYCNKTCQTADFKAHSQVCKDARLRRALVAVCETVRDGIKELRKQTYERPLVSGEYTDPRVEGYKQPEAGAPSLTRSGGRAYPLPEPLWSSLTAAVQDRILFEDASEWVTIFATYPLATMLAGIARTIIAILIFPNGQRAIHHALVKCVLQSGEVFAIDISGAQHGWASAVYPFEAYMQSRSPKGVDFAWCMKGFHDLEMMRALKNVKDKQRIAAGCYKEVMVRALEKHTAAFLGVYPVDVTAVVKKNDVQALNTWLQHWLTFYKWSVSRTVEAFDGLYQGWCTRSSMGEMAVEEQAKRVIDQPAFKAKVLEVATLPEAQAQKARVGPQGSHKPKSLDVNWIGKGDERAVTVHQHTRRDGVKVITVD